MDLDHLAAIRAAELDIVINHLREIQAKKNKKDIKILEIGAGSGWQAAELCKIGFNVEAVDTAHSNYARHRIWPVTVYDGVRLPYAQSSFDVIFSSSVLEHIPHLESMESEMLRVLKQDGIAVHLVPSATWRIWTTIAHYPNVLKKAIQIAHAFGTRTFRTPRPGTEPQCMPTIDLEGKPLWTALFPSRHGERGNAATEAWFFTRRFWRRHFEDNGWKVQSATGNRIFYSGFLTLSGVISAELRRKLSRILGSSCHVFVLSPRNPAPE